MPAAGDDDDDDDFDELWADLEDDNATSTLNVSANLLDAVGGKEEAVVHKGDVDEGKVTWEPPKFAGLTNSDTVTIKMKHWYKEEAEVLKDKSQAEAAMQDKSATDIVKPDGPAIKVETVAGTLAFTPKSEEEKKEQPFTSMFSFTSSGAIQW